MSEMKIEFTLEECGVWSGSKVVTTIYDDGLVKINKGIPLEHIVYEQIARRLCRCDPSWKMIGHDILSTSFTKEGCFVHHLRKECCCAGVGCDRLVRVPIEMPSDFAFCEECGGAGRKNIFGKSCPEWAKGASSS